MPANESAKELRASAKGGWQTKALGELCAFQRGHICAKASTKVVGYGICVVLIGLTFSRVAYSEESSITSKLSLPGRFGAFQERDVLTVAHSGLPNVVTHSYPEVNYNYAGETHSRILQAVLWGDQETLAVLVQVWAGEPPPETHARSGERLCDVALIRIEHDHLSLRAIGVAIAQCNGFSKARIDEAPYYLYPDKPLLGVREELGDIFPYRMLDLVLLTENNGALVPIFDRQLERSDSWSMIDEKRSDASMIHRPGHASDLALSCYNKKHVLVFRRVYRWNGHRFRQVSGSRHLPPMRTD